MIYNKVIRRIHKDEQFYGWHYLEGLLDESIRKDPSGVDLDCFTDSYIWSPNLPHHDRPWVGIIHLTESGHSCTMGRVISNPKVAKSISKCVALVTLSQHAKECLQKIVKIPVFNTYHPKKTNYFFNLDAYFDKPTLNHAGFHARNVSVFEKFKTNLKKTIDSKLGIINKKIEIEHGFKDNNQYIKNLCSRIGFCYLNTASANNSILEHIVSHTPIVVNRLPAVEEYIGSDYPMYYEKIKDNPDKFLLSKNFILETSNFLKERSKLKIFDEKNFVKFFLDL